MNQINKNAVNISAPNLINICVNGLEHGEIQGEFYHYYSKEPVAFQNILELVKAMEKLFDELVFPQASTRSRSFFEKAPENFYRPKREEKRVLWEELLDHSGIAGTFITCVKFRQSSTWQGDLYWKEQGEKMFFSSALEFIRLISRSVNAEQNHD